MLSTGEVDAICFDMENNPYPVLNRLSVIKLLSTIKKQHPVFFIFAQTGKKSRKILTPIKHNEMEKYM